MTIKKGKIREHHFAHKPPFNCIFASGESQKHYKVKREIYQSLINKPQCTKVALERILKGVRPDISLYVGSYPVAIEVQKSTIDLDEIIRRTITYSKLGIYIIWLLPDNKPANLKYVEEEKKYVCRPHEWHKFLHAMYFGKLYYWKYDSFICPVHLDKYEYYVEPGNWVEDFYDDIGDRLEGTYWHDENYYEAEYGGYMKTHKNQKCVCWPNDDADTCLDIVTDFRPTIRKPFQSKNWTVPPAKLWIDNLRKWW